MPTFECPKCGKRDVVPLTLCEHQLPNLPRPTTEGNDPVYLLSCPSCASVKIEVVEGDLLDQNTQVIVNAWNRNIIPWWLLLPQGVSGAIKRRGGTDPFKALGRHGPIPLGGAVYTTAGRLPFKGIIHVAGINMFWRASEYSVRQSVRNAMKLAHELGFSSIAFPLIGAGSGGLRPSRAKEFMVEELAKVEVR